MDEYSSRKAAGELAYSRKASARLALRDSASNRDRNSQLCSRDGCSSRMNATKSNQIGNSGKAKTTRHTFHLSTSGKEVVGCSSRTPLALTDPRKSSPDPRKKLPCHQAPNIEINSLSQESEASEPIIEPDNSQIRLNTPVQNTLSGEASSSSSIPHARNGKKTLKRSEQGTDDISIGASSSRAFKHSNPRVRNGAATTKYDFKNLNCNSVNDAPSGCSSSSTSTLTPLASSSNSSSELNLDGKRVMGRKRIVEGEGSLHTRGKKINGTLVDGRRNDTTSQRGISITNSRRARNSTFTRDNEVTPVGSQRSTTARARLNEQEERNRLPSSSIPLLPQPNMPVETLTSEYQFPSQGSTIRRNASRRPVNRAAAPFDVGFGSSLVNRESDSQYSLDGIAEMLLALDRIGQDEELSYERLLVLETNIFLTGLSFSDQHRDMRLDIDNMSYEELLALEERMGSVSTALTEEALEKCIKKSIHQTATTEEGTVIGENGDENKCSICQEEYKEGDEVGRLGCEHQYHFECIEQWLQVKNWCPICKSSAAPSPMGSPSDSPSVS